jgi:tetratricopeptide (TPR) repeat protein
VAQGDLAGALKSYRDGLAIAERLAQSDPGNAGWQRDLSVSYNICRCLTIRLATCWWRRATLPVRSRPTATASASSSGWRNPSVSYNNIGGVQVAQGDLAGALTSYRDSLGIRERLAQSDPSNAGWQRDLARSYARLADVYRRSNDRGNALAALRQGKAIMDRLVKLSPDNAGWKGDLAWFDQQIAALTE